MDTSLRSPETSTGRSTALVTVRMPSNIRIARIMNTHTISKGVQDCDVLPPCFRSVSQATFPGDETNPCHSIPRDCRESEHNRSALGQRLEIVAVQSGWSQKMEGHIATTKDSEYRQAFEFRPKFEQAENPDQKMFPLFLG